MSKAKYVVIDRATANSQKVKMQKANQPKSKAVRDYLIQQEERKKKEKEEKKPENYHSILIPALDTLIGDPRILEPEKDTEKKADYLYIPTQFFHILGQLSQKQPAYRGDAARKVLDIFSSNIEKMNGNCYECANGMIVKFVKKDEQIFEPCEDQNSSIICTLATARKLHEEEPHKAAVYSGDSEMLIEAKTRGLDVAKVNPDVYTGRRRIKMTDEACAAWFKKGYLTVSEFGKFFPKEKSLNINEFVEFVFDENKVDRNKRDDYTWVVGRFHYGEVGGNDEDESYTQEELVAEETPKKSKKKKGRSVIADDLEKKPEKSEKPKPKPKKLGLHRIHYIKELYRNPEYKALIPSSVGQAMLAESLMAPCSDIPIVICPATFGTGKTYLTTNIGLLKVRGPKREYGRVFVCPRDSQLGEDIGAMPGDLFSKVIGKSMPTYDSICSYIQNTSLLRGKLLKDADTVNKEAMDIIQKYIELCPIINMGGRNISDAWIIFDEAQDLERGQIIQLMERLAERSKMVIIGDPSQVTNRHMNETSNGVSYAASKMAGSWTAAVITMTKDEIRRCEAAIEIANRFGL